jgi:predicted HNH restriction endonuclease
MSECEKCGYDEVPGILIVHHKDRNRANNELNNLAVLCPNCHAIEHLEERKNKWQGHTSANPEKIRLRIATQEKRRAIAND